MRRRAVLLTVGGTLARTVVGCTSSNGGNESPSPTPTASLTPTTTSSTPSEKKLQRLVTLDDQDSVPETHQVSINVEILDPAITTAQTARLRVTMTNEGQTRAFKAKEGYCKLSNGPHAGSDDSAGLWLYQPQQTTYFDRAGKRWVPDWAQSKPRFYSSALCSPQEYESEESVSTEYEVWDDYQVDGYLQPNTYWWEQGVEIWEGTEPWGTDSQTATFTWGFSLSVEKAD